MQERNLLYILNISIHLGISENFCQFLLQKNNYGNMKSVVASYKILSIVRSYSLFKNKSNKYSGWPERVESYDTDGKLSAPS